MAPKPIHGYLLILYSLVSVICFQYYGIKIMVDSERYLSYARNLSEGFYIEPHDFWYFSYVLFIYTIKLFSQESSVIIICQYIIGYLAVVAIYETGLLLFNHKLRALFPALLMIGFIEIPMWNSFILSEPFYISFTCFSIYFLVALYKEGINPFRLIAAILIVLITVFSKPTGIALLGGVGALLFYRAVSKVKPKAFKSALLGGACVLFLLLTNKMLSTYTLIENDYVKGEIIYGISGLPNHSAYEKLKVMPPDNLYIPAAEHPPLVRIVSFIIHHPIYWLKLFFAKFYYFIMHIRPYWSVSHNLFSLLFLIPIYGLSIRSLVIRKFPKEIWLFLMPYFTIHILSVCLSTVDWDGRFLMPLLPVLFLLAAAGIPNTVMSACQKILPFLAKD